MAAVQEVNMRITKALLKFCAPKALLATALTGALAPAAFGGCLTDLGPYEDDYGWARFPFRNDCEESVSVSLCVKSFPEGSDEAVYNSYSQTVNAHDRADLTDGLWRQFDSYRWQENTYQYCPFE
jgi:hypothetical protein